MAVIQNAIGESLEQNVVARDMRMEGGKVEIGKGEGVDALDVIWGADDGNKCAYSMEGKLPLKFANNNWLQFARIVGQGDQYGRV